ncbi:hypothetical protein BJK06_04615 [Curtobacterium sp. BH-2-1-1]|nr:hypothetical protein BJK06_04615 [Curtobacterium sp. BH-2-1-1]
MTPIGATQSLFCTLTTTLPAAVELVEDQSSFTRPFVLATTGSADEVEVALGTTVGDGAASLAEQPTRVPIVRTTKTVPSTTVLINRL